MKKFLLLLFFPLQLLAQPTSPAPGAITGAWQGYVNSSQKKLPYELVITDSSGILTGFSKIIFTIKGEEYSIVKSLIIKNESGKYIIEEDKVLYDNIQDDAPKKIRQINTLALEGSDKNPLLNGSFKTKVDRGQRAASGDISLHKIVEPDSSKLLAELDQMELSKNLSFREPSKEPAKQIIAKTADPDTVETALALNGKRGTVDRVASPVKNAKQPVIANAKGKKVVVKTLPPKAPGQVTSKEPVVAVVKERKQPASSPTKTIAQKPTETKPAVPTVATLPPPKRTEPVYVLADIGNRHIETIQTVYFKTDSLKLTLYDNGEVDGDTVSVILNGRMVMNKKGLSTNAISETVYITPEMGDSLQMVMYAENLGTIPPNTGLLIVQDGRDRYEIRFSGDLNKNAAIIFRRKK